MNKTLIKQIVEYILLAVLLITATLILLPNDQYEDEGIGSVVLTKKTTTTAKNYKLLFMGDTMLARSIGTGILGGNDPYTYVANFLKGYDVNIANIETTIAPINVAVQAPAKAYTFNAPIQSLDILKKHIDVAVLANNHTKDFGSKATATMLDSFSEKGIVTVGAGKSINEAFKAVIIPVQSYQKDPLIRVAIIAINDIENNYTNVKDNIAGSAYFDKNKVQESIAVAKNSGADIIIVMTHWGVEYTSKQTARQKEWEHFLIDSGADAVIGGHPHVTQLTEEYKGKPIVYSMGNFIFDGMSGDALKGNMIELPITVKLMEQKAGKHIIKTDRDISIASPITIPIRIGSDGLPRLE